MSDQNPATTTAKPKGKGNPRMKEAWELHALMKEMGFNSAEDMRAALSATAAVVAEPLPPQAAVTTPALDLAHAEVVDPLSWITEEVPYVGIVSGTSTFVLRQQNLRIQPPITRIAISSERTAIWGHCPFVIGDPNNHIHDQNMKVLKSNWHLFRVRRELARDLWADERHRKPTDAVIGADQYQGWDRPGHQARGDRTPLAEFVPLRELVRYLLQKSGDTFMDHGLLPAGFEFDPRYPNPYRNRISSVKVELKPFGN